MHGVRYAPAYSATGGAQVMRASGFASSAASTPVPPTSPKTAVPGGGFFFCSPTFQEANITYATDSPLPAAAIPPSRYRCSSELCRHADTIVDAMPPLRLPRQSQINNARSVMRRQRASAREEEEMKRVRV